jgi:CheY-like chemotaxis protein
MSRVFIVDDEKQIRRILSVMLSEQGHQVAEAESGEQAMALQLELQPDIVLLDLSMPGTSGMETLKKLLEQDPRVACIMMTAYGTIRSAVEAMRLFDRCSRMRTLRRQSIPRIQSGKVWTAWACLRDLRQLHAPLMIPQ